TSAHQQSRAIKPREVDDVVAAPCVVDDDEVIATAKRLGEGLAERVRPYSNRLLARGRCVEICQCPRDGRVRAQRRPPDSVGKGVDDFWTMTGIEREAGLAESGRAVEDRVRAGTT